MFIEVQDTPNPNTKKFFLNEEILSVNETYHFKTAEEAKVSPLCTQIFTIEGIRGVFLGNDFLSVIVTNEEDWFHIKPLVIAKITDFMALNLPVIDSNTTSLDSVVNTEGRSEEEKSIIIKIQELFEERIRPAVAMDGGDIIFRDYEDGVVFLSLYGSCSGCPSSTVTLKNGIENMLKYYLPEVKEVISIE